HVMRCLDRSADLHAARRRKALSGSFDADRAVYVDFILGCGRQAEQGMRQQGSRGQKRTARRRKTARGGSRLSAPAGTHGLSAEERYRLVIEAVAEGIYEWSVDTGHLEISARLNEM